MDFEMRPYLQEYYPAKLNKDGSNKGLVDAGKSALERGNDYLTKNLYHIKSDKEAQSKQPIKSVTHSEDGYDFNCIQLQNSAYTCLQDMSPILPSDRGHLISTH